MKYFVLKIVIIFSVIISESNNFTNAQWIQMGADIIGESPGDHSGASVSLNSDGTILAIGSPEYKGDYEKSGQVRIFKNINGNWIQTENILKGNKAYIYFGYRVVLSRDGNMLAISSLNNGGTVQVYKYINNNWEQLGSDILCRNTGDKFGRSIDLNSNGSVLVVGAPDNQGNSGFSGSVSVYQFVDGNWQQIGQEIKGVNNEEHIGYSVSINSDGSIMAAGACNTQRSTIQTQVFKFENDSWIQLGEIIKGEESNYHKEISVDINSDGLVLAIGDPFNDGNGESSGHVRIFEFAAGKWQQLGQDIDGIADSDNFGTSVSLNSNGNIVGVSAVENDENGLDAGSVSIFEYIDNNWVQSGTSINGKTERDEYGTSISLNAEGSIIAIGTDQQNKTGIQSGYVSVFKCQLTGTNNIKRKLMVNFYPNPAQNTLQIEYPGLLQKEAYYTIIDLNGKILQQGKLKNNTCDVSKLSKGLLFLNLNIDDEIISEKILIN